MLVGHGMCPHVLGRDAWGVIKSQSLRRRRRQFLHGAPPAKKSYLLGVTECGHENVEAGRPLTWRCHENARRRRRQTVFAWHAACRNLKPGLTECGHENVEATDALGS